MKAEIVTELHDPLIHEWGLLWQKSKYNSVSNSPHWTTSAIEAFGYDKILIIVVRERGNLVAVAPLIKKRLYGLEIYTTPAPEYVMGLPFLYSSNKEVAASARLTLLEKIQQLGTVVLREFPLEQFDTSFIGSRYSYFIFSGLNYYAHIDNGLSDNKRVMTKVRKAINRAKNDGIDFEFEMKSGQGDLFEIFRFVKEIDDSSQKNRNGYSVFSDDLVLGFYKTLALHFGDACKISFLLSRNQHISFDIGWKIRDTYYSSQIAYSSNYSRYSPGLQLDYRLVQYLCQMGVKCFDFGSGENYNKTIYADNCRKLYIIVYSKNVFIANFLRLILESRNKLYLTLEKYRKIYSSYRYLKKLFPRYYV